MTNLSKWQAVEIAVQSKEDVDYLLEQARENRSVAATALN